MPRRRHSAMAVQCAIYVCFAVPIAMLGAGWPAGRHLFHRPTSALGILAGTYGIGRLVTSPAAEPLLRRWHIRHSSAGLLVGLGLSCAAIAWTRSFAVLAVAVGVEGLCAGGLDALGAHFQTVVRNVGRAGLMFGAYGIGATAGPILVTLTSWTVGFSAVAVLAFALAWFAAAPPVRWPTHFDEPPPGRAERSRVPVPMGAVVVLLSVFAVYCGIEMVTAQWGASYLRDHRHTTERTAGLAMSGFWAGLTLGRLGMGWIRTTPNRLLVGGALGVAVAYVGLATLPTAAALACLALGGLAVSVMFPALMSTTADRVGTVAAGRVAGWELLAANLAETGLAASVGILVTRGGSAAPAVLVATMALVGLPVLAASIRLHATPTT